MPKLPNATVCAVICALLSTCPHLPARADLPVEVHAYDQAPAPCVETTCFIPGWSHPPVVNNHGEVAFMSGLACSHCFCDSVMRTSSAWVVTDMDTYLVATTEEVVAREPCPLSSVIAPGLGTYDTEMFYFSDRGDVLFAKDDPEPRALWMVERDCREDSECASGMCDLSGACLCDTNDQCRSGNCRGSFCELASGPVYYNGQEAPGGVGTHFFSNIDRIRVNAHGVVVFASTVQVPGQGLPALFRKRPGEPVEMIYYRGQPAPGFSDYTFFGVNGFAVSDDPNGTVVMAGTAESPYGGLREAVWSDRSGTLEAVALEYLDTDPPDGSIGSFNPGVVEIDDDHNVFFHVNYVDPSSGYGLFMAPPGVNGVNSIAALTKLTGPEYRGVDFIDRLSSGQIASLQTINEGAGDLWRLMASGTEIVRQGQEDPDGTGPNPLTFGSLHSLTANRAGQVAFIANLAPDGVQALYLWDPAAGLQQVVRVGSQIEVTPGVTDTVSLIKVTNTRSTTYELDTSPLNDFGKICFWVGFEGDHNFGIACTKEPPTVHLVGLEAIQSVQNWRDSVMLVEGKWTMVRAHMEASEGTRVVAWLKGVDKLTGQELPGSPLAPNNTAGYIRAPADAQKVRHEASRSLYWMLPPEWTRGLVELEVLEDSEGLYRLRCEDAAFPDQQDCMVDLSFEPAAVPEFRLQAWEWWDAAGNKWKPAREDLVKIKRNLKAMFPVANVDVTYGETWFVPSDNQDNWPEPPQLKDINLTLWRIRAEDGCGEGCKRIYVAVTNKLCRSGERECYGKALGAFVPDQPYYGLIASGTYRTGLRLSAPAHEIGHLFGLQHPTDSSRFGTDADGFPKGPCDEVAGREADPFPHFYEVNGRTVSTIGPIGEDPDATVWGFDRDLGRILDPQKYLALMGYCGGHKDDWISSHYYPYLYDDIYARFGRKRRPPGPPRQPQDLMMVRGTIDAQGTVGLMPLSTVRVAAALPSEGQGAVRLYDAGDNLLVEQPFDFMGFHADYADPVDAGEPPGERAFAVLVPVVEGAVRLAVLEGDTVLAEKTASANPPTVQITYPNGGEELTGDTLEVTWTASDADGDQLWFALRYSPDDGQSWVTVAADWPRQGFELDRAFLAGSDQAIFEVQASDGFHSVSDRSDAVNSMENHPPQVGIQSPREGYLYAASQVIELLAWTQDPEDGELPDDALVWSSDLDGQLQVGHWGSLAASGLSEGEHRITAEATDSHGATGSASVNVRIMIEEPPDLADVEIGLRPDPEPAGLNLPLRWIVTVTNLGPELATGLELTVPVPDDAAFQAVESELGSCQQQSGSVACQLDELALDQQWIVEMEVAPQALGIQAASASVTTLSVDPVPSNDTASATAEVKEEIEPPDGGPSDGGSDGGTTDAGTQPGEGDGGCGCQASAGKGGATLAFLLLMLIPPLALRRRRLWRSGD